MKEYKCPKCRMEYDRTGKCSMDGATLVKADKNHEHAEHKKT